MRWRRLSINFIQFVHDRSALVEGIGGAHETEL